MAVIFTRELADLLERRRAELELGHRSLADKSHTPRSSIKRYLADPESMRVVTLNRVLGALGLSFKDLAALEDIEDRVIRETADSDDADDGAES